MELKQALAKLNKNQEYTDLVKKNKGIYFSYALITIENNKTTPWQIGFYNKSTDKMTTFIIGKDKISIHKEEEIFKFMDGVIGGIFIMTKGPEGVVISDGKNIYRAGVPDSPIIERTGAGDAFSSTFTIALALGFDG